jgi:hypothetical protein
MGNKLIAVVIGIAKVSWTIGAALLVGHLGRGSSASPA